MTHLYPPHIRALKGIFLFDVTDSQDKTGEITFIPTRTSSCVLTHYTHTPLSPLSCLGTGSRWHRWWWWEDEIQRQTHTEGRRQLIPPSLNQYISLHKSHVPVPNIYPCAIQQSIHPSFNSTTSIYHPPPPPIHQCSIWAHSTIFEHPQTSIHPLNMPICQSVPWTRSYLVSWPFTHLLTSVMWLYSHPSFPSCFTSIYLPVHSHQSKICVLGLSAMMCFSLTLPEYKETLLSTCCSTVYPPPCTGSMVILALTSCMPHMKAKVHLPLQHPMVSSTLSPVIQVVKNLSSWLKLPKSPAGPWKSQAAPPRGPVWLESSPGGVACSWASEDREQPLYSLELGGIKGLDFVQKHTSWVWSPGFPTKGQGSNKKGVKDQRWKIWLSELILKYPERLVQCSTFSFFKVSIRRCGLCWMTDKKSNSDFSSCAHVSRLSPIGLESPEENHVNWLHP